MHKIFFATLVAILPWFVKYYIFKLVYKYDVHPSARVGFSLILVKKLTLLEGAKIRHLNVIKGVEEIFLAEYASVGNLNWISGFSLNTQSKHFCDSPMRYPGLFIGAHSAITNRHLIDCTDRVSIGKFSTFAGFRSQVLTHSISIAEARQRSAPISIGDYVFIGTACILLPSSELPSYSVLGAGSILNKKYKNTYTLYAGNPAKEVSNLDENALYFHREVGFIL